MRRPASLFLRRANARRGRASRFAVFSLLLALGASAAAPSPDVIPANGSFPIPNLRAALGGDGPTWSVKALSAALPRQKSGKLPERVTQASAKDTRARGGAGRRPGSAPGALAADRRTTPKKKQKTTPRAPGSYRFDAKTSKRVSSAGTATSDVFRNADGSYTRRVHDRPVNFRAADGSWSPIDATLVADSQGRLRQKANSAQVSLAPKANDPAFAAWPLGTGKTFSYGIAGATSAAAEAHGDTVTYRDVLPHVDVEMSATAVGAKETLLLKSASAPTSWTFPLSLDGLTAKLEKDGSVSLRDAAGAVRAEIPAGHMEDSAFNPKSGGFASSFGVTYQLTGSVAAPALQVSVDKAWVSDPKRKFPIKVDPTTNLSPTGDTFVLSSDTAQIDHSSGNDLQIGTWNPAVEKGRAFLHFDTFGDTYSGAKLTAVNLHVYDSWANSCDPQPFSVSKITQQWADKGAKTFPGPSIDATALGSATLAPGIACTNSSGDRKIGTWMTVPISKLDIFKDWTLGKSPNYGLALTASETDYKGWKRFTSSDGPVGANGQALGPYLDVTYEPNAVPQVDTRYPENGAAVPTLTPQMVLSAHDADNYPNPSLAYEFLVFDKAGTKVADSGGTANRNWTVPAAAKLKWGETYTSVAFAYDGSATSDQDIYTFTTSVPQPPMTSTLSDNGDKGFDPNSGNFTTAVTDASIPTVGPPLGIQRWYNSRDPRKGAVFGDGWSSVLDMAAEELLAYGTPVVTGVKITYPNGQEVVFGKNPDGTFAPPLGRFATLKPVTGGGYQLTDKDGTTYTLNYASRWVGWNLTSIKDAAGRTETFTYNGAIPAETSRLVNTITSASGRKLYIDWSGWGASKAAHVLDVRTDPTTPGQPDTANKWIYKYALDPTGRFDVGKLLTVCPPTSATACTNYNYVKTSLGYAAMMNASPTSYWPLSETSGTVASSAIPDNRGSDNALYENVALGQPGAFPGSSATSAVFNGATSRLKLPSSIPAGGARTVSMWVKVAPGSRGTLFSVSNDPLTKATTPSGYLPAMYIGSSGLLHAQFWTGTTADPIPNMRIDNGDWHFLALTSDGATTRLFVDYETVATKAGVVQPLPANSNIYVGGGFIGGNWPDQPHYSTTNFTAYPYMFNGPMAHVGYFDRALSDDELNNLRNQGIEPSWSLSSITSPAGRTVEKVDYDPVTQNVKQVTDNNGGVWKIGAPVVSGSFVQHSAAVLGSAPREYWRLADTGGASAVNEIKGTSPAYNRVTLGVPGGPFDDPARSDDDTTVAGFDAASGSYVALDPADVPSNKPTSVAMWFKVPAGSTGGGTLFGYQTSDINAADPSSGTAVPALYVGTDGKLRGGFWTGAIAPLTSAGAVNDGKWHHVVLAAKADSQTLYLDGEAVGTKDAALVGTSAGFGYLGAGAASGQWPNMPAQGGYFTGQLAEVSLYPAQLSASAVQSQFFARKTSGGAPIKTITVTDPNNKPTKSVFDVPGGRKVADTDALGNTTRYGYDVGGFSRTVTDPNGVTTITEQDVRGNTISSTTCQDQAANHCATVYYTYYPDATTKVLTPDPRNDQLLTMRDGRSASATDDSYLTKYDYDTQGNRTAVTDPLKRITTSGYTDGSTDAAQDGGFAPPGLPKQVKTAEGAIQNVVYFKSGDVAKVTDPAGKVTAYTYDVLGRVATQKETTDTFPAGLLTTFTYDKLGRLKTQTYPATTNRVTGIVHTPVATNTYDDDGNVLSQVISDPTGKDATRTQSSTYNALGQSDTTTDPDGKVTKLSYDAFGQPVREEAPDGTAIVTAYDFDGRMLSTSQDGYIGDPNNPSPPKLQQLEVKSYDPAGRVAYTWDAMGWRTHFTYTDDGQTARTVKENAGTGESHVVEDNSYDAAGNLTTQVTNDGATTTTFVVDAASRVKSSTLDPDGLSRTVTQQYSPDDHVLNTTVSSGSSVLSVVDSTYDPLGHVKSRTVHNGSALLATSWNLDQNGLAKSMTDPDGHTTDFAYDEAGRLAVTTAPQVTTENGTGTPVLSRSISMQGYDAFGEQTETKDPNGNVTVVTYDAAGRDVTTQLPAYTPPGATAPITPVTTKSYDTIGMLHSVKDARGYTTTYSYDQLGNVSKVATPNGGVTTFTYDPAGHKLSTVDPVGATSTATYDYLGRTATSSEVVRQSNAVDTTQYTYGKGGWLMSVKTPSGVETSTTYNAAGEEATSTDGAGNVTTTTYDGLGRKVRITAPDGTSRGMEYDQAGRQVAERSYDENGNVLSESSSNYDGEGNLTSVKDARGTAKTMGYDATGMLTSLVEPVSSTDSITSTFGYDLAGNRTRFTDGRGSAFLTTYNSWNLPDSQIEPATTAYPNLADRTFRTAYDAGGLVSGQSFPGGVQVTNTYDEMGNLRKQEGSGAEAATADRQFTYDLAAKMLTAVGGAGTSQFTWDDRGQLLTATGASGSSSFDYNADGAMTKRTDAAGTTDYTYDTAGRLATVNNPQKAVRLSLGYTKLSQVDQITYGDKGSIRKFSYDKQHRLTGDELTTQAGSTIGKIQYGYDANDNETAKTTTGFAGSAQNTYTYDLADRLASWNDGTKTVGYAYDKSGNRTKAGGKQFTYDERNQLKTVDNAAYHYTPRGTLRQVDTPSGSLGTLSDAFGQVITQATTPTESVTNTYDGLGRVVRPGMAYSGMGNTLASDGTATYTRGVDGDLLGVASGDTNALAWTDQHQDVVGQFSADGTALSGSTAYDPLGKVLQSSAMVGKLGYQSEFTDFSTGRVNMWARWYNTETGQFDTKDTANVDPVPDSVEANDFAYGNENPMTTTDPTGHWGFSFSSIVHSASKAFHSVVKAATQTFHAAVHAVESAVHAVKKFVTSTPAWKAFKKTSWGKKLVSKYHAARKWYAKAKKAVHQQIANLKAKAKRIGKAVVAKVTRVVTNTRAAINDGMKWVREHKEVLIEVGAIATGIIAGLACTLASGGAAVVGCMVGASAVINLTKDYFEGNIHNFGDALASAGTGALEGLAGAAGGAIGGRVAAAILKPLGKAAGSLLGRVLGGGISGGVGGAVSDLALTGHVKASDVLLGTVLGAVTGGAMKGCHSFDPNTKVLMADGSKKPIKNIKIGQKIKATDPVTGKTMAKSVTALHKNRDTDLTDITILVGHGRSPPTAKNATRTVLHTTQHHLFWDKTDGAWIAAGVLVAGHQLLTAGGSLASVAGIHNYGGAKEMRDLTVANVHTYYVQADQVSILVHNCGVDGASPTARGIAGRKRGADVEVRPAQDGWTEAGALEQLDSDLQQFARDKRTGSTASRTYVGALNTTTGETVLASSGSYGACGVTHCAEGNAHLALGGDVEDIRFTGAVAVEASDGKLTTVPKPVCVRCQADYPRSVFAPGVVGATGGVWGD